MHVLEFGGKGEADRRLDRSGGTEQVGFLKFDKLDFWLFCEF